MPDYNALYPHLGHLHNEGVEFVIERIRVNEVNPITKNSILNFTAEYMHTVACCHQETGQPTSKIYSQISVVDYADFLYELHSKMSSSAIADWLEKANLSQEQTALLNLLVTDDDTDISRLTAVEGYPSFIMASKIASRIASTASSIQERQIVGMTMSVATESMRYAYRVEHDQKKLREFASMASRIDYNQTEIVEKNTAVVPPEPSFPNKKKEFRWSWKSDLEGTLSGLISGVVGGMVGGIAGAAIGGGLGALGGGVSNSIIKSIPAFK